MILSLPVNGSRSAPKRRAVGRHGKNASLSTAGRFLDAEFLAGAASGEAAAKPACAPPILPSAFAASSV
jgi:hypothetical protein